MWPAVAAAALALATLAAIEPRGLFGDVRTRKSDDEVKPRARAAAVRSRPKQSVRYEQYGKVALPIRNEP